MDELGRAMTLPPCWQVALAGSARS